MTALHLVEKHRASNLDWSFGNNDSIWLSRNCAFRHLEKKLLSTLSFHIKRKISPNNCNMYLITRFLPVPSCSAVQVGDAQATLSYPEEDEISTSNNRWQSDQVVGREGRITCNVGMTFNLARRDMTSNSAVSAFSCYRWAILC